LARSCCDPGDKVKTPVQKVLSDKSPLSLAHSALLTRPKRPHSNGGYTSFIRETFPLDSVDTPQAGILWNGSLRSDGNLRLGPHNIVDLSLSSHLYFRPTRSVVLLSFFSLLSLKLGLVFASRLNA